MTSPLARIKSNPQSYKRLIGIKYEDFLKLVSLAEQRHLEKQAEIEKKKVRLIASGGGRKPEMTSEEVQLNLTPIKLCFIFPLQTYGEGLGVRF